MTNSPEHNESAQETSEQDSSAQDVALPLEKESVLKQLPIIGGIVLFVRSRLVQGLLLALPIAITFWILHWLYRTLRDVLIDPVARVVSWVSLRFVENSDEAMGESLPYWFDSWAAPVIAVAIILGLLYFFGMFFQSRIHRLIDWFLLQVPVVTNVYSAVRQVFTAIQREDGGSKKKFQRVVLVPFPHQGMRAPAFVTSSCTDKATGRKILCVYVPTTPIPTSGYMLMVPEEDVTDLSWDLNETLQAIVSGGIAVPEEVDYFPPAIEDAAE